MDRADQVGLSPGAISGRVVVAIVATAAFVLDRVTKGLVQGNVVPGTEIQVLPHLWLTNTNNSGAAFSIGTNATSFLAVASVAVAFGLVVYVIWNQVSPVLAVALGLILGGTIGNGYDRIVHGTVTDFVSVHFFPVFNMADAAVTVGVLILLATYLRRPRPR